MVTRSNRKDASSKDNVWCVDGNGQAYKYASGSLSSVQGAATLSWLSVATDGTVWGVDKTGTALLYEPGSWTPQLGASLSRISVGNASTVCAIGQDGTYYKRAAGAWTSCGSGFKDISVTSEGMAWGLDTNGRLFVSCIAIENVWHSTGWTLQLVLAGSLSNIRGTDENGQLVDLTNGKTLDLAEDEDNKQSVPVVLDDRGVPEPTGRTPRFDTEDPFDESQSTHLWIVKRGIQLASSEGPTGANFCELFQPDDIQGPGATNRFQLGLCMGLYEADFNSSYNDPHVFTTYASHFYNPVTEENWLGQLTPTALTRGCELWTQSLVAYGAGNNIQAGYCLGLALHYLTDLGQPHHAVNFTNIDPPFMWHGQFEKTVMKDQNQVAPPAEYTPVSLGAVPHDHFVNLAKASKELYDEYPVGPNPVWTGLTVLTAPSTLMDTLAVYQKGTQQILEPMLQNAVRSVSQFVVDWMKQAKGQPVYSPTGEPILLGLLAGSGHLVTKRSFQSTTADPWTAVTGNGTLGSVALLQDGRLLAADLDSGQLYTTIAVNANWQPVAQNNPPVQMVTVMPNGKILAVGTDGALWTKDTLDTAWSPLANSAGVVSVAVMQDGRLVGVGTGGDLFTKDTLTSVWKLAATTGGTGISVTVLHDGTFLLVNRDNQLYGMASLPVDSSGNPAPGSAVWTRLPDSGFEFIGVIEIPSNYVVTAAGQ